MVTGQNGIAKIAKLNNVGICMAHYHWRS